ncbi:transporter [Azonexus hydrophilus]|uniref:Transporter n=1 Tax=Azonexus hydrophilus TaxID=418702 RepID=A0A1R1I8B9_9RHOO|nr:BON domain-containing protein [Azonexus hydrophilus]OMG54915.1 transporter [Azonexus hydrophilus]
MTQKKTTLITISLLFALGMSACEKPGPAEEAGKKLDQVVSDAGKKVDDVVDKAEKKMTEQGEKTAQIIDDTEITAKVKGDILAEPGLKSLQISVDTVNGAVTLSGSVDLNSSREKAGMVAAAVNGVKEVNNQLIVGPAK